MSHDTIKHLLKWLSHYTQAHVGVRHLVGKKMDLPFGTAPGMVLKFPHLTMIVIQQYTEEMLREKAVGEIKRILDGRSVDYSDCLEKGDLIQRVLSTAGESTSNGT